MWNKIEDVRPSNGEVVVAFSQRDGISYETHFTFNSCGAPIWQRSGRCNMEGVTHWMPKLSPPKSDNAKSSEHLSCNDAAYKDVRAFIEERKISEDSCTQPTIAQQAIPAEALREIAAITGEVGHINQRINGCLSQLNNINKRLRQLLVSP